MSGKAKDVPPAEEMLVGWCRECGEILAVVSCPVTFAAHEDAARIGCKVHGEQGRRGLARYALVHSTASTT